LAVHSSPPPSNLHKLPFCHPSPPEQVQAPQMGKTRTRAQHVQAGPSILPSGQHLCVAPEQHRTAPQARCLTLSTTTGKLADSKLCNARMIRAAEGGEAQFGRSRGSGGHAVSQRCDAAARVFAPQTHVLWQQRQHGMLASARQAAQLTKQAAVLESRGCARAMLEMECQTRSRLS
jgi:hypothetical protein